MSTLDPYSMVLDKLWKKGTEFLGCRYGILGGAMTWVSDYSLVSAISQAGGFGVLAGGSLSPDQLEHQIQQVRHRTQNPFGVNLITFHPAIEQLIDVCGRYKVTHVFLGGGLPSQDHMARLKNAGSRIVGFAPSLAVAQRLIRSGAEALVVEGCEAGGHVGPVSTSVLAQEIIPQVSVPVFVAGGIGDGLGMLMYLFMGAAGCQLGTRFVCAQESCAHPSFKQAFIRAHARDAVLSIQLDPQFPVIPVRALANQGTKRFMECQQEAINEYRSGHLSQKEAQMKIEMFWAGALRRAVVDGDLEEGSLMAGQSVGMVKSIEPCADIIATLINQASQHLAQKQWSLQAS